jgi:hypothetical protein
LSIVLTIGFSTTGVALFLELENQSPKEALALVKKQIGSRREDRLR